MKVRGTVRRPFERSSMAASAASSASELERIGQEAHPPCGEWAPVGESEEFRPCGWFMRGSGALRALRSLRADCRGAGKEGADRRRCYFGLAGSSNRLGDATRAVSSGDNRRVWARPFLCLPAGSLEWRLRRARAPLPSGDETLADARCARGPVAPAKLRYGVPARGGREARNRHGSGMNGRLSFPGRDRARSAFRGIRIVPGTHS